MKFDATIYYTIDRHHPDYKFIIDDRYLRFHKHMIYTFDVYDPVINPLGLWSVNNRQDMIEDIKHKLALVAGGGKSAEHIHDVSYNIRQI